MSLFYHTSDNLLRPHFKQFLENLRSIYVKNGCGEGFLLDMLYRADDEYEDAIKYLDGAKITYIIALINLLEYDEISETGDIISRDRLEVFFGSSCMEQFDLSRENTSAFKFADILYLSELCLSGISDDFIGTSIQNCTNYQALESFQEDYLSDINKLDESDLRVIIYRCLYLAAHQMFKYSQIDYAVQDDVCKCFPETFNENFILGSYTEKVNAISKFCNIIKENGLEVDIATPLCEFATELFRLGLINGDTDYEGYLRISTDLLRVAAKIDGYTYKQTSMLIENSLKIWLLPLPRYYQQQYGSMADKLTVENLFRSANDDPLLSAIIMDEFVLDKIDSSIALKRILDAHNIHDFDYGCCYAILPKLIEGVTSYPDEFSVEDIKAISVEFKGKVLNWSIIDGLSRYLNRDSCDLEKVDALLNLLGGHIQHFKTLEMDKAVRRPEIRKRIIREIIDQGQINNSNFLEGLPSLHPYLRKYIGLIKNPQVKAMILSTEIGL